MNSSIKLGALILIFLCMSCGPHRVYTTGSYASVKSYTEKQHYVDSKTSKTYVSADVSFGKHMQEDHAFDDNKTIVSINAHRATTGKFYNLYYGFGASAGRYKFKRGYLDLIQDGETHAFYNVNLKAGLNFAYNRPKIDYRFLGIELAYHNEFGPYQDKLSELEAAMSDIIIVNKKSLFTYNLYSEYAFKFSDNEALTLGFYFGDLINSDAPEDYEGRADFSGFIIGYRKSKYGFNFVFESGENDIRSTKFGITYQL